MNLLEKVVLRDGTEVLLFNPRYTHAVNGQVLVGSAVSEEGQPVAHNSLAINPADIAYTVGMKRTEEFGFEEDRSVVPPSLR
jgi:hypothetical protein